MKVGDRIAGFVHGSTYKIHNELRLELKLTDTAANRNGSFAEFLVADPAVAIRIPETWSFEEAAQLGVAGFTGCLALYDSLSLPNPFAPTTAPLDLLVWGASSSMGQYIVQLASQAGIRVIATASPKNFELVKSFGAGEVLDYRDAKTTATIREITGGKLKYAVDCIAEGETRNKIAEAIGDEGGVGLSKFGSVRFGADFPAPRTEPEVQCEAQAEPCTELPVQFVRGRFAVGSRCNHEPQVSLLLDRFIRIINIW